MRGRLLPVIALYLVSTGCGPGYVKGELFAGTLRGQDVTTASPAAFEKVAVKCTPYGWRPSSRSSLFEGEVRRASLSMHPDCELLSVAYEGDRPAAIYRTLKNRYWQEPAHQQLAQQKGVEDPGLVLPVLGLTLQRPVAIVTEEDAPGGFLCRTARDDVLVVVSASDEGRIHLSGYVECLLPRKQVMARMKLLPVDALPPEDVCGKQALALLSAHLALRWDHVPHQVAYDQATFKRRASAAWRDFVHQTSRPDRLKPVLAVLEDWCEAAVWCKDDALNGFVEQVFGVLKLVPAEDMPAEKLRKHVAAFRTDGFRYDAEALARLVDADTADVETWAQELLLCRGIAAASSADLEERLKGLACLAQVQRAGSPELASAATEQMARFDRAAMAAKLAALSTQAKERNHDATSIGMRLMRLAVLKNEAPDEVARLKRDTLRLGGSRLNRPDSWSLDSARTAFLNLGMFRLDLVSAFDTRVTKSRFRIRFQVRDVEAEYTTKVVKRMEKTREYSASEHERLKRQYVRRKRSAEASLKMDEARLARMERATKSSEGQSANIGGTVTNRRLTQRDRRAGEVGDYVDRTHSTGVYERDTHALNKAQETEWRGVVEQRRRALAEMRPPTVEDATVWLVRRWKEEWQIWNGKARCWCAGAPQWPFEFGVDIEPTIDLDPEVHRFKRVYGLPSGYKSEWQTKGTLATALQPKLAAIAGQLFLEAYTRKLRKAVIQHLGEAPSPELNQQEADWTVALIGEPACSELGELWYVATLWKEAIDGARAEQE